MPARSVPQFLAGWYAPEREGPIELRPMSAHSVTRFPPSTGETILRIEFRFPEARMAAHSKVTIALNGHLVDRFTPSADDDDREYHVKPAPNGAPNMLDLSTDQTIRKPGDPRAIGMSVKCLSFGPE